MPHTFLFFKSTNAFHKTIPDDMEAQLLVECNGFEAEEVCTDNKNRGDGVLAVAMMLLCFGFLSMFTLPVGLERELGFAGATEAMESVEFKIFVVMNAVSFFSSMGVVLVLVLLQATAYTDDIAQNQNQNHIHIHMKKKVMNACKILAHIAMVSTAIAFVSAAMTFTRHR